MCITNIYWITLYETFTNCYTCLKNLFATLGHVPCDVPEDRKLYATAEQNYYEFLLTVQVEECFIGEPCDVHNTQNFLQYRFLLPHKSVISCCSIFWQWLTRLNFVWEQWEVIMTDTPCSAGWVPNLLCQMSHTFSWICCFCLLCCSATFCHANRCTMFTSLHMFITDTSCFFELCNSLIDGVSWLCNTSRKLSRILSVHGNKSTTRRVRGCDDKHFLVCHMWHHLVIQFSVANGNKEISQVCRTSVKVPYSSIQ